MHITVVGAAGATGQLLVQAALNEGATVVVYTRHPDKLRITNDKLSVVQGELSDAAAIGRAVQGSDGVVSLLGQGVPVKGKPIAAGTRNILDAMQKAGVRRIVAVTTASAADPADRPPLRSNAAIAFAKLLMRPAYDDVVATAQAIRASDRDWTIVPARQHLPSESSHRRRRQEGPMNGLDRVGRNPLHHAAAEGDVSPIRELLVGPRACVTGEIEVSARNFEEKLAHLDAGYVEEVSLGECVADTTA